LNNCAALASARPGLIEARLDRGQAAPSLNVLAGERLVVNRLHLPHVEQPVVLVCE
jgi:hypothetical protein